MDQSRKFHSDSLGQSGNSREQVRVGTRGGKNKEPKTHTAADHKQLRSVLLALEGLWPDERLSHAHPITRLNPNCSLEPQTMNTAKGHLLVRNRGEYRFRGLVDRTIREQRHQERRLAEQRGTKHQFWARNSCVSDGRNYRIARRLLLLARAHF